VVGLTYRGLLGAGVVVLPGMLARVRFSIMTGMKKIRHALSVSTALEAAGTRFEHLKAREAQEAIVFRGDGRSFFRSGRAGGWREALTTDQARGNERDHGR